MHHVLARRLRRGAVLTALALAAAVVVTIGAPRPAGAMPLCERENPPPVCEFDGTIPTISVSPYGALDNSSFGPTSVRLTGWAGDPSGGPVTVVAVVDGVAAGQAVANLPRAGAGGAFDFTVPASPASSAVCVRAVNIGPGSDTVLGCAPFPWSTPMTPLDLCGVVTNPQTALLWRLTPPSGQIPIEVSTSSGGRIGFASGSSTPGASIGVSLSTASLPGPLYRSGPLAALPRTPLNVVVPCPVRLTAAQLNSLASSVPLPPMSGVTISSVSLVPGSGTLTLTASGTGTTATFFGPVSAPFTYSLTFGLTPSTNMNDPSEVVLVRPTGPGTLSFGGTFGWALNPWAGNFERTITASAVPAIQSGINNAIRTSAAAASPGGSLPAGATVSMGRVVITPSGASLTAAVGWFG